MDVSEIAERKARSCINEVLADPRRQNTQIQKYPRYTLSASGFPRIIKSRSDKTTFADFGAPMCSSLSEIRAKLGPLWVKLRPRLAGVACPIRLQ